MFHLLLTASRCLILLVAVAVADVRGDPLGPDGVVARRSDPDHTNVLVIYGNTAGQDGETPFPLGTPIHVRNSRTGCELTASVGEMGAGQYEVVFLDYQTNVAAATGDSLLFGIDSPDQLDPSLVVLARSDIEARQVHADLRIVPPAPVGACCLPDGSCQLLEQLECTATHHGSFMGDGIACGAGLCPDPNSGVGPAVPVLLGIRCVPNPFIDGITLRLSGQADASVRVVVFDASGRLVRVVWDGPLPMDSVASWWDGRDGEGNEVSAGVYLVRICSQSSGAVDRVVKIN